jgi:hypothetical protein
MAKKVVDIFSGQNLIPSEEQNYSELLSDFIKPFENDFHFEMTAEDRVSFAVNAWNLGCISQVMTKKEFENMFSTTSFPKAEMTILKKMIELKKKKYAKFDMFIDEFELEEKHGQQVLSVITQRKEDFINEILEDDLDIFPELADYEEAFINRQALIIKPLKPLFDWVNSIYPEESADTNTEPNIYLINEGIDNIEGWLKKEFERFFSLELFAWHSDENDWPQKRTYKMFRQWFSVDISTMVYDMENEPIIK